MSKGVLYMIFNWRERLKKKSSQDLLQIFNQDYEYKLFNHGYQFSFLFRD